jgi:hypothetical protein
VNTLIDSGSASVLAGADHDHHDLFVGNDTISGSDDNDVIIGDHGTIVTPAVTGVSFSEVETVSPANTGRWQVTTAVLANEQARFATELEQHRTANHDLEDRTIDSASLDSIIAGHAYELTMGNDTIDGNTGEDALFGDFGVIFVPSVDETPQTPDEVAAVDLHIEQLMADVEAFLVENHHELSFAELEASATHNDFSRRNATHEVPISAGNDMINGGTENDIVLGDSGSLIVTYLTNDPLQGFVLTEPEFELDYFDRERFELTTFYSRTAPETQLNVDNILGGDGDDFLYGQFGPDTMFGEAGDDIVYGGDGQTDIVDGGTGNNDVRDRGDDAPKNDELTALASSILNTITVLDDQLQTVLNTPNLNVGPLPFTHQAGTSYLEFGEGTDGGGGGGMGGGDYGTVDGIPIDIEVSGQGAADGTWELKQFTQPENGTITDNGDGTLRFVPAPGFVGSTSFEYSIGFFDQRLPGSWTNADEAGSSVAVDGTTAVVGSRLSDVGARNGGAAYVMELVDGAWTETAVLTPADINANDWFGTSVAIDGDTIVVGSAAHDAGKPNTGAAYVFQRNMAGGWDMVAKLLSTTADRLDQFGYQVDVSGDTIAVSAWLEDDARSGSNQGAVYLFGRDIGGTDAWGFEARIVSSHPTSTSFAFGTSLSLDDDRIAVGAPQAAHTSPNVAKSGEVYVFERAGAGGAWQEVALIKNPEPGPRASDQFGTAVSLSGGTLAVGAPFHDENGERDTGAVYVFEVDAVDSTIWTQEAKLVSDSTIDQRDGMRFDRFGAAVSIEDDRMVIGAPYTNYNNTGAGVVYEFTRGLTGWQVTDRIQPTDTGNTDRLGSAVAIAGNLTIFGSPRNDRSGTNAGGAYIVDSQLLTTVVTIDVESLILP